MSRIKSHEALVLDVDDDVFTLTIEIGRDVVNVAYKPKNAQERALLALALRFSIPLRADVAGKLFVVAVHR